MRKYPVRYGVLTAQNAEQFTEQLKTLLADKLYTFVAVNEMFGLKPTIRVNQYLCKRSVTPGSYKTFPDGDAENIHLNEPSNILKDWRNITVCDSYGVFSISTDARFAFYEESTYEPERVVIEFVAGANNTIVWTIYPTGDLVPENVA